MPDETYFLAIKRLAEYEVWCNARAIDAARGLEERELFQAFPFGLKTIHATLFHTIEVFQLWSGCVGPVIAKPPIVPYDAAMTLDRLAEWNEALSLALLRSIDDAHAAGLLHRDRRVEQVFHLVTHGTHHRTQFITMLRLLGRDPPYEAGDFGGWNARCL